MRVVVEQSKCAGHGRCYDIGPDVFGCDDDGYVELLVMGEIPELLREQARLAVLNCPENALTLDD